MKELHGRQYSADLTNDEVIAQYRAEIKGEYLMARDRWKRIQVTGDDQLRPQIIQEPF